MNPKTILTIVTAAFVGSVASETCSSTQQASAYTALASLLTLSSFQGCVDDSSYSLLYSTALPTDAEYVLMCASDNCQSLITSIISLGPPDCTLTVPTSGLAVNVYELANGFSTECSSVSTTASSTTTPTAGSTSTEATTTTEAASSSSNSTTEVPIATATPTDTTTTTTTATAC